MNHPTPWKPLRVARGWDVVDAKNWAVSLHSTEEHARLIAAAPDMLETLEELWPILAALTNGDKPDKRVMQSLEQKVVDAIAKAKND